MNKIKGIFYTVFCVALLLVACDPVENSYTSDTYMIDIYTVNNNYLIPEFDDTLLAVTNFSDFDLNNGERACVNLHYHYDAFNSKNCEFRIINVVEKISDMPLAQREGVDIAGYDLPLTVFPYWYQPSVWLWDNRLNVNAKFAAKPDATDFVMSLRAVQSDTLLFNLFAKTTMPSDTLHTKLLSYDLNNVDDLFTDEEKEGLKGYEKLKFRIFMKNIIGKDSVVERVFDVQKGEFVNPLF